MTAAGTESYKSRRLKQLFRIVTGSTPKTDEPHYWDGGIPWVTPDDLGRLDTQVIRATARTISDEGLRSCATTLSPPGSLVLSTRAPIGYVASTAMDSAINQGCRALIPRTGVFSPFYRYVLSTRHNELQALGRGSTFQELSTQDLGNMLLPAPRYNQQQTIARFLDKEAAKIDAVIEQTQRLLSLIDEQRSALITAAVTGQIDVRGVA